MKHATGEWLTFLDSDDFVEPTYLSSAMQAIHECAADYCQTSHKIFYEDTRRIRNSSRRDQACGSRDEVIDVLYFRYILGKVYSLKIIRENGLFFDESVRVGEDTSFNFDYFSIPQKCVIIPDAGYVYRRRPGSVTSNSVRPEKKKISTSISETSGIALRMNPLFARNTAIITTLLTA